MGQLVASLTKETSFIWAKVVFCPEGGSDSNLPDGAVLRPPRVERKSHFSKIAVVVAITRLDTDHEFGGNLGIWHICVIKADE